MSSKITPQAPSWDFDALKARLFATAYAQIKDKDRADDVVQETLISITTHQDKLHSASAFNAWALVILKNKLIDHIRQNQKYVRLSDFGNSTLSDEEVMDYFFDEDGAWQAHAAPMAFDDSWQNPETALHTQDFWAVLESCLTHLPSEQAQAFLMKEYLELSSAEICQTLGISTSNFYTLMHRARLRLQKCLSVHWFDLG